MLIKPRTLTLLVDIYFLFVIISFDILAETYTVVLHSGCCCSQFMLNVLAVMKTARYLDMWLWPFNFTWGGNTWNNF